MQQRYHLSFAPDFKTAHAAKIEQLKKTPEAQLQIRRRKNLFELVGRISVKEAIKARETLPGSTIYSKRKKPRRLWKERGPEERKLLAKI